MADVKISDAVPIDTLDPTDMIPLARVGQVAPYKATMLDFATFITQLASTAAPPMSAAVATAGTADQYARADHVHPTDGSLAPKVSPVFTGNPRAPTMSPSDSSDAVATTKFVHDLGASGTLRTQTPGIDDNTELVATTEFVINQAWTQPPLMDGAPTAGVSLRFSRGDHTHPTDTTRAAASAIPGPSSTAPVMDGTAAVGAATTWARADHVHPVDTSRYAASNPSGFQTAAQVATALVPYQLKGGTTTNDNAAAGQVGEYVGVQRLSTAGVTLVTGVDAPLTSFVLTPGDWDVWGSVGFTLTSNNGTTLGAWINPAGVISPSIDQMGGNAYEPIGNNSARAVVPITPMRVSIAASTTVTLGCNATFGGGTHVAWGKLMARRVR